MALFVLFCILAAFTLAALVAMLLAPAVTHEGTRQEAHPKLWCRVVSYVFAGLAALCLFFSAFTVVGTKNVAVMTLAGRPVGFLDNGWHWKAPWEKPHEISDAVQTDTYASDPDSQAKTQSGATSSCVHVRIERQAIACVNVSIRWQIIPAGVDYLYRNYKSNEHITDNVVLRDLQQSLNVAFASYDPLGVNAAGNNTNPPLAHYSDVVQRQMTGEIGKWIDVQSVIVPLLSYDGGTQDKVQKLLQQIALTRVAQQSEQTAVAQAKANKALAASVSNDPNVLVSKCLDILKEAVDRGQQLPAGFSCFGPSTNPVAVQAK